MARAKEGNQPSNHNSDKKLEFSESLDKIFDAQILVKIPEDSTFLDDQRESQGSYMAREDRVLIQKMDKKFIKSKAEEQ